jgi:hypothetical protein
MATVREIRESFFKTFARAGAKERLRQLDAERAQINKAFPELSSRPERGDYAIELKPRRVASAKARAAMSEGMRRYWAKRKAGKKVVSSIDAPRKPRRTIDGGYLDRRLEMMDGEQPPTRRLPKARAKRKAAKKS